MPGRVPDEQVTYSTAHEFAPEQLMLGTSLDVTSIDSADQVEFNGELRWVRRITDNEATIILCRGVFLVFDRGKTIGESGQDVFIIQSRPDALKDYLARSDAALRDMGIWLSLNATEKVQRSPALEELITTLKAKGFVRNEK